MKIDKIKEIVSHISSQQKLTPLEDLLLAAVESLLHEREHMLKEIQNLKDEIRRLKNEQGKPQINENKKPKNPSDISSEKERNEPKPRKKSSKKNKVKPNRTEIREVDKSFLPEDAVFKGYDEVVIQNILIKTDNILFKLECWYSKSEGKTYRASVDPEYEKSEFSPELRAFIIDLYYSGRMSQFQIVNFLKDKGIYISEGTISNILTKNLESYHQEIDNINQIGLECGSYHQIDDTGARHNGTNGSTMILCNPYYTCFLTSNSKNRFQVLRNLLGGEELSYSFNKETVNWLKKEKLGNWILEFAESMEGRTFHSEEDLQQAFLENKGKMLSPSKSQWEKIFYYSAVTYYSIQQTYKPIDKLICDDAPQFKIPGVKVQLCWVHVGRNFKVLAPFSGKYQQILNGFINRFWKYYRKLQNYRQSPNEKMKKQLYLEFDELFQPNTGYEALDNLIKYKLKRKEQLLLVLEYPEIPIHNNHAEQQFRSIVMKRKISSGTRSMEGRKARDTWMGLMMTCKKLGIGFLDYLIDRIRGDGQIPALDAIIRHRYLNTTGFT
jgi:hypothetical protein